MSLSNLSSRGFLQPRARFLELFSWISQHSIRILLPSLWKVPGKDCLLMLFHMFMSFKSLKIPWIKSIDYMLSFSNAYPIWLQINFCNPRISVFDYWYVNVRKNPCIDPVVTDSGLHIHWQAPKLSRNLSCWGATTARVGRWWVTTTMCSGYKLFFDMT